MSAPNRSESIAARIRDEILGGAYRPGERLPAERHLATQLGVNRGSLREALKRLEQLGLVTTRRGGGTTVRPLHEASVEIVRHLIQVGDGVDRRLLEQFLDVHEMLLAGASYLAVERAGPAEVERARRLLARLAAASDPAEFHELTGELVDVITEASGNLVLQLWRNSFQPLLREGLQRLHPHLARDLDRLRGALAAVDAALVERDPVATERSVRALYRLRREWILAAIDAAAQRGDR